MTTQKKRKKKEKNEKNANGKNTGAPSLPGSKEKRVKAEVCRECKQRNITITVLGITKHTKTKINVTFFLTVNKRKRNR